MPGVGEAPQSSKPVKAYAVADARFRESPSWIALRRDSRSSTGVVVGRTPIPGD